MLHLGLASVQRWVERARSDALVRCLLGTADVPAVACHYDFVNRATGDDPHMDELFPARKNSREVKAELRAQGAKRGDKWVNWDEGDARGLKERYWDGAARDAGRWTLALERPLDLVAVRPSLERYGLGSGDLTLSGDGSALHKSLAGGLDAPDRHIAPHGSPLSVARPRLRERAARLHRGAEPDGGHAPPSSVFLSANRACHRFFSRARLLAIVPVRQRLQGSLIAPHFG